MVKDLEKKSQEDGFWNDNEKARSILKKASSIKKTIDDFDSLNNDLSDIEELMELAESEDDQSIAGEINSNLQVVAGKIDDFEFRSFMSKEEDQLSAILSIHPGAGGTESQDWASMLMRMYLRWAEDRGYTTDTMDYQSGEEAGIKSVTIEISGDYAYGYLKSELGVHRLVRISPFDAGNRRHTSFASVFVYPETNTDIIIEIKQDDLKIDTYRASGAGGQHVNKTSSAVRITHIPTKIVVQCQSQRSQFKNREAAMKVLKARLYQKALEEERAKMEKFQASKKKIEWGSQIRSYVFHPYNLVKDHRTGCETSNTNAVMDGGIDLFIHAFLSHK